MPEKMTQPNEQAIKRQIKEIVRAAYGEINKSGAIDCSETG